MYACADVMEFRGAGRKECPKKGGNDTNHQGKDAKCRGGPLASHDCSKRPLCRHVMSVALSKEAAAGDAGPHGIWKLKTAL